MEKDKKKGFCTDKKNKKKLYSCSLPYNKDLIKLFEISFKEIIPNGSKNYTRALINVTFKKSLYEYDDSNKIFTVNKKTGKIKESSKKGKELYDTKQIRDKLYEDGFIVDSIQYVLYKRSSSKAREGGTLFIKKTLYNEMMTWSRMGMTFEEDEDCDLASLRAYESLTLSSLDGEIVIKADEILLIDDKDGEFTSTASVTEFDDKGDIITHTRKLEIKNSIWDGQSLACSSLFPKDDKGHMKGMMLLRNRWFKSCAFNTNIRKFFKEHFITEVFDMFDTEKKYPKDASKIKLIITPNSLKLFKFKYKIGNKSMEQTYKHWIENLDIKFGICKNEKASRYNGYNKLSYQMVNSMPFSKDDLRELLQEELDYVELLKNNPHVFKHYISNYDISPSRDFVYNASAINSKFASTQLFKDFKRHTIDMYIEDLRQGKLKVPNTDYATICGNPYEMLQAAIGEEINTTLHKGKEIWCEAYKDGEQLVGFRNPHICAGNVLIATNKYHEEFKYFNFKDNKNIVITNSFDNDIMDRLQGQDFDSDNLLISNNSKLLERGLECVDSPTPINKIKIDPKLRKYNKKNMSEVDHLICRNKIGPIVNKSQILNSYYWHEFNNKKDKPDEKLLALIYEKISMLSSLSQLEIDKAKRFIEKDVLNMDRELDKLNTIIYNGKNIIRTGKVMVYKTSVTASEKEKVDRLKEEINFHILQKAANDKGITNIKKKIKQQVDIGKKKKLKDKYKNKIEELTELVKCSSDAIKDIRNQIASITKVEKTEANTRPMFFKYCGEGKEYSFEHFDTPMDFLQEILDEEKTDADRSPTIDINEILVIDEANMDDADRRQIAEIKTIVSELDTNIKAIYADATRDKEEDTNRRLNLINEAIEEIKEKKVSVVTILNIFNRIHNPKSRDKEISKYKLLLISTLWMAHADAMEKCFKNFTNPSEEKLVEDPNGTINIWGVKYKLVNLHANLNNIMEIFLNDLLKPLLLGSYM